MKNRIPQLRVKLKSLAAESVILRNDTKKHTKRACKRRNEDKSPVWSHDLAAACSLHQHRVTVVRFAARQTLLALAALRGVAYARCEPKTNFPPDLEAVVKVADRFGPEFDYSDGHNERVVAHKEKIARWLAEAKAYLEAQGRELPKSAAPAPSRSPSSWCPVGNPGVQWGWRVTCRAPGCQRTQEGWSPEGSHGPPQLPNGGSASTGPLAGWFVQFRARYRYREADDYGTGFVAYCPLHSTEATAWQAAFQAWEQERYKIGKTVALGLFERLAEWLSPAADRQQAINRQTGEAVRAWKKEHPAPKPPWA